jgi:hypothetical protein
MGSKELVCVHPRIGSQKSMEDVVQKRTTGKSDEGKVSLKQSVRPGVGRKVTPHLMCFELS